VSQTGTVPEKPGWLVSLCSRVAGERKTEFGYFASEKKQSCLQVKFQEKRWVGVRRIYGVGVCLLFAKDVWGCRRLKIRGWSSTLFCKRGEACGTGFGETRRKTRQQQSGYVSRCFQHGGGWTEMLLL